MVFYMYLCAGAGGQKPGVYTLLSNKGPYNFHIKHIHYFVHVIIFPHVCTFDINRRFVARFWMIKS